MNKEENYRRKAAESVDLANRTANSADKGRLLELAERWLDLADRAHNGGSHIDERDLHPLIKRLWQGDWDD